MNQDQEKNPVLGQKILDNIWLLLILGISFPMIFYFLWGVFEVLTVPTINYLEKFPQLFGGK